MRSEPFKLERNQTVDKEQKKNRMRKRKCVQWWFWLHQWGQLNQFRSVSFGIWIEIKKCMRKRNFVTFAIVALTPLICCVDFMIQVYNGKFLLILFRNDIKLLNDKHQRIESERLWNVLKYFLYILQSVKTFNWFNTKVVFCCINNQYFFGSLYGFCWVNEKVPIKT